MSEKTFKVRITECSVGGLNYESAVGLQLEVEECIEIENSDHYFRVTENNEWLGFYILKSDCTILPDEQPQKRRIEDSFERIIKKIGTAHNTDDAIRFVQQKHDEIIADKDREIEELKKEIETLSQRFCESYHPDTLCCTKCCKPLKNTDEPKLPDKIGTLNFADSDSMVMRNKINEIIDYMKTKGL